MPTASCCEPGQVRLDGGQQLRTVVLFGPPNGGKTTLYTLLTRSRHKTVNYPGATVESASGFLRERPDVVVLDTPGIVSVVARTADERVAAHALSELDRLVPGAAKTPDVVVTTVDATQPVRHLALVRQMQRSGIQPVVVLTMNDLARAQGRAIDPLALAAELGSPVVAVDGRTGQGLSDLLAVLDDHLAGTRPRPASLPEAVSEEEIRADFAQAERLAAMATPKGQNSSTRRRGERFDRIALHPVLGPLLFAGSMSLFFWCVFAAAAPFQEATNFAVASAGSFLATHLPDAWYSHLLVDGVVAGVGSVLVFVPQIAILFLLIGLMEDSGYLARGAVLVDRPLAALGLNGKAFVPLLSGYACAIPAAMAARTIPGRKERFLTLLVIPLMSCSARLPVWGLLLAFLIPPGHPWTGGFALTAIYFASTALASVAALAGGRIRGLDPSPAGFQIELPSWRAPILRNVAVSALDRTASYMRRAGATILTISVLFWAAMALPSPQASVAWSAGHLMEPLLRPLGLDWRVGVALVAAFAAREVFVSALTVVFTMDPGSRFPGGMMGTMHHAVLADGSPLFTVASCAGLVVFFLVALQCLSTVAVIRHESGSWKFALGQMASFLAIAWVLAALTVQGLRATGIG
jgi:ferrous iron transport protein B